MCILSSALGFGFGKLQPHTYKATSTFIVEDKSGSRAGGLSGLASQFGIDVGGLTGGGAGLFDGDNILEIMKSRAIIEKVLLSKIEEDIPQKGQTIADYYFTISGMDKSFAKPIFTSHGIATAPGIVVKKSQWQTRSTEITKEVSDLGYPVFVKPARGGSSRGTSKVKSEGDLTAAVLDAFSFDPKIMIEKAIVGSEIECAVLEIDGQPQASIVGKIVIDSKFEFYDFEAKYLDGATTIELPAPIEPKVADEIRALAIKAFKALDCRGLARVDFFLTPNNEIIINELNTMPGFTPTSVFPKMWAATGVGYTEIISYLLEI